MEERRALGYGCSSDNEPDQRDFFRTIAGKFRSIIFTVAKSLLYNGGAGAAKEDSEEENIHGAMDRLKTVFSLIQRENPVQVSSVSSIDNTVVRWVRRFGEDESIARQLTRKQLFSSIWHLHAGFAKEGNANGLVSNVAGKMLFPVSQGGA